MKKYLALCLLLFSMGTAAQQPNLQAIILPPTAQTAATINTADQNNIGWKGAYITINVTARTSGTYTPTIQGKDPVSGQYYTILAGAGISATGLTTLVVYPGAAATANVSTPSPLPRVWRVQLIGTATPVMTFSVGASLIQ